MWPRKPSSKVTRFSGSKTSAGNTFSVVGVSYDPASPTYNSTISTKSIYRITLENEDTISIPYFSSSITGVNTNRKPTATLLGSV